MDRNAATALFTSAPSIQPSAAPAHAHSYANFDYLRHLAAVVVVISHALVIAAGDMNADPFHPATGLLAGGFAVGAFFVISGFLITKSAFQRGNPASYALSRVLRIYPELLLCLVLSAFVLAPWFSSQGLPGYYQGAFPFRYVIENAIIPGRFDQRSISFYQSELDWGWLINGSLWTLPVEIACYAVIGLLLAIRRLTWHSVLAVLVLLLCIPALFPDGLGRPLFDNIAWASPGFFFGALYFFAWQGRRKLPAWPIIPALATFPIAVHFDLFYPLFPIYAGYPLLYVSLAQHLQLPSMSRLGDHSYGIYLYGWPSSQLVMGLAGGHPQIAPGLVALASVILSVVLAAISWRLVAQPALRLKPALIERVRRRHMPAT